MFFEYWSCSFQVESGILSFNVRLGLLRVFLYNYPIVSSLLIIIFTYFTCLIGITLYWFLQAVFGSYETKRSPEVCTEIAATEVKLNFYIF